MTMKYKNKWTICGQGHNHQSKIEAEYCNRLFLYQKINEIQSYKNQIKIPIIVNEKLICNHIIDFEVVNKNGIKEWHEVKGFETKDFKIKRKLIEALYPEIEYIVVKKLESRIV